MPECKRMEAKRRQGKRKVHDAKLQAKTDQIFKFTHVNEMDRWNLCLRPRNIAKDFGGKDRAVTVQYGCSYPPAGHSQRKPPPESSWHVPPLRHTPGTHLPCRRSNSHLSPAGSKYVVFIISRFILTLYCFNRTCRISQKCPLHKDKLLQSPGRFNARRKHINNKGVDADGFVIIVQFLLLWGHSGGLEVVLDHMALIAQSTFKIAQIKKEHKKTST